MGSAPVSDNSSTLSTSFFTLKRRNGLKLFMLVLPLLILVFIFSYLPLLGWSYAFIDYVPGMSVFKHKFVGLRHFKLMFSGVGYFPTVMRNTLVLSAFGILLSPTPVILAIMVTHVSHGGFRRLTRPIQTATSLPNFISWVLVYSLFFALFNSTNGAVNEILLKLNLIEKPTNILINSDLAWYFQLFIGVWKGAGWNAIIYFAAISGIDPELYDAADVDGAGTFQKIIHVTVPGIMSTYFVLLLMSIANILSNGFEQYYVFQNALTVNKLEVLDTYIYKIGLANLQFSLSTAMGIFKSVVSIILLTLANTASKAFRGDTIF